jgi:TolB-like protein/DNA-binding winged helix-turn-helix (wHTH) protein/Tfp pilus assembly protein PilF
MTDREVALQALDAGFRLAELTIEPRRSCVTTGNGEERRLEPRAMTALVHLAAADGVVRRDELIDAVWQTAVTDEVVSRAISLIRQALGDSARAPRFVETIPKVGYRLLVAPELLDAGTTASPPPAAVTAPTGLAPAAAPPDAAGAAASGSGAAATSGPTDPGNAHWTLAWVLMAGALAWLLWLWIDGEPLEPGTDGAALSTIAVLPLQDQLLSDDVRPIGLGLADTLRTELGRAPALRVLARSSSIAIAREAADARELGERFGIDAVLEGSVLQDGERIAIQLSLADAREGLQSWARTFEGRPDALFDLGREAVAAVSLELTGEALGTEAPAAGASSRDDARRPTSRAYAIYLQGLHYLALRGEDGLERADQLFSKALEADPSFDAARVARARTLALLPYWSTRAEADTFPAALAVLDEVTSTDPQVRGVGDSVRALIAFRSWDWETAGRLFERAVRDAPADAGVRAWHAQYLATLGDLEGSLREAREAWDLDPGSPIVGSRLAAVWLWMGRPDRAEDFYDQTDPLRLAARDPSYLIWLLEKGRLAELESLLKGMHGFAGLETDWIPAAIDLVSGEGDTDAIQRFEAAVAAGQVLAPAGRGCSRGGNCRPARRGSSA